MGFEIGLWEFAWVDRMGRMLGPAPPWAVTLALSRPAGKGSSGSGVAYAANVLGIAAVKAELG